MGDRNASTEPSLQGTVLISSSPEVSIYCFKIKIFAVLVHSHFSMKHLDLLKKGGGGGREPFFQTSNIFQNASYLLTFIVSYKAQFWFPELKGIGMILTGGNAKFQQVLICQK